MVGASQAILLAVLLGTWGCSPKPTEFVPPKYDGPFAWPPNRFAKVVGYSFEHPKMTGLLSERGIDMNGLEKFSSSKAELSKTQTNQLLGAVLKSEEAVPAMLCYMPHHIFVFYSELSVPVAAIEVCFSCNNLRMWPDAVNIRSSGIDLPTLAYLANALDLGLGSPQLTLPKYLENLRIEQEKEARLLREFQKQHK
jgi:hypothetical protein